MNFERDQPVDAVVLMFWMSCRSVRKPVFPKFSRPHRNDATHVRMASHQIEGAKLQGSIEQQLDVVQEQEPVMGSVIRQILQKVRRLQVSLGAWYREQLTAESRPNIENSRLSARR